MKQITTIIIATCLLTVGCKKSSTSNPTPSMAPGTISYTYKGHNITFTGDTDTRKEYAFMRVEVGGSTGWVFDVVGGLATDTINAIEVDLPSFTRTLMPGTYSGPDRNGVACNIEDPDDPATSRLLTWADSCNITVDSVHDGFADGSFNAFINGNYVSNGTFKNLYIYYDGQ